MPFCPNCGKEVSEDVTFCLECGQRLKGFTPEERQKYINELKASIAEEKQSNNEQKRHKIESQKIQPSHPTRKGILVAVIVIACVIGIPMLIDVATSGEPTSTPPQNSGYLAASFTITDWEQTYYEYSNEWSGYVYIYYEVENTGNVEIDYYKVYFTVTCMDGSEYYDWTNGTGVGVGHKLSDYTLINVAGKQVVSVEIIDWEIKHYR